MGYRPNSRSILACSSAMALCLAVVTEASAQDQAQTADAAAVVLAPITVTALKRAEDPSEMAVGLTVVDDPALLDTAFDPGAAITRAAPNVTFGGFGQPGNDFVNIRGIGPLGQPSNSLDTTVGFATNGIATSAFGFPPSLLDVDRVEVLRGPQGTLFGRNALGGVINVVTTPADGTREFTIGGEIGTEGHAMGEAKAGGWLFDDTLAGRVALRYQALDGDVANPITGTDEGDTDLAAARGTLRFTPNERLAVNVTASVDRDDRHNSYSLYKEHPQFPISGADIEPSNRRDRADVSAEVSYDFDHVTLTSITNVQRIDMDGRYDLGDSLLLQAGYGFTPPLGMDIVDVDERENIFSQEVRLNSAAGAPVSWVAGVHYFLSDYSQTNNTQSSYSPYGNGLFQTDITSRTVSAFGDVSVPVTDRLTVSAGARVSHDDQDFSVDYTSNGFPGTAPTFTQDADLSETYLTGRLALSYDWTDSLMTYASVSRGHASGGFQKSPINAAVGAKSVPFDASSGWTYEVGGKAGFLDGRGEVDVALFYNVVDKGQLVSADASVFPAVFSFINQNYISYGAEMQTRVRPIDDLEVSFGLGLTQSKLKDIEAVALGIKENNQVPMSPNVTANVGLTWYFLDDFSATAQYQYVGERYVDVQNTSQLDAYSMVNARIGWTHDGLNIYAFGNNLLDERPEYFGGTYSASVHGVAVGAGRVVGIGASMTF